MSARHERRGGQLAARQQVQSLNPLWPSLPGLHPRASTVAALSPAAATRTVGCSGDFAAGVCIVAHGVKPIAAHRSALSVAAIRAGCCGHGSGDA